MIEDSLMMGKPKSITKTDNKKMLKSNFGSVDYTNINKMNNLSQYNSNQILLKKSSQQVFVK